ncbi:MULTISPECIES: TlpA disulfide reductase family protein [unclassified Streptococcus]|uniref:TlpA family protein disulfide reductase n=1 Tax=unclassified Streptococcus TaxID=2608887 RepID=UPI0010717855|nr:MULTISPECIES: TlpA disulfide reductase family protein [unclassified Streptococcus]MBF0786335.1 TlpA family protein disulfide reductase [Streptococcus sp. 19428wC2_LYSM12]MCQ9212444.1 TlpA family protein disulfide reductase [Streptococcus sp. B01]MCQ9213782.1 TlpA family protein disulfide reductase [Streptococcus sp. O1]TFV06746.1 TlpA family protein disulfide reductase [Streptococcus sp. LYSM12]
MKWKDRWWLPFLIVGLIVTAGIWASYHLVRSPDLSQTKEQMIPLSNSALELEGSRIPEFRVIDKNGLHKTEADFSDKPMLIVEWASWCPDCQKQLPVVQEVYKKYGDKVNFVMINLSDPKMETKEQADHYIKQEGFHFPYYYDNGQQAADSLKVQSIPTMYFVDKDQQVKKVVIRFQDEASLEAQLKTIL